MYDKDLLIGYEGASFWLAVSVTVILDACDVIRNESFGYGGGLTLTSTTYLIPPDVCPLRYGSDPVLLHRPAPPSVVFWVQATLWDCRPQLKVCVIKTTAGSVSDWRISRRACVCLFFEICVLASTRTVLFWKVTGCYIVVSVLDFLSARC